MKEGNIIKPISDSDAKILRENNYGWAVQCGHGTYNRYLMTEDRYAMKFLKDYHDSIRVKTVIK